MIGVLAVLVMMACCAAFILGLVVLAYPLKQLRLSRRWHGAALSGGAFVVFMIAGLGLPAEDAPGPSPESPRVPAAETKGPAPVAKPLKAANDSIRDTAREGDELVVDVYIEAVWSQNDYVSFTGVVLEDLINAIQTEASEGVGVATVRLDVSGPGSDRLGNPLELALLSATYDMGELRQVRTGNLSQARTLNLATAVSASPQGREALRAWCVRGDNFDDARSFCLLGMQ